MLHACYSDMRLHQYRGHLPNRLIELRDKFSSLPSLLRSDKIHWHLPKCPTVRACWSQGLEISPKLQPANEDLNSHQRTKKLCRSKQTFFEDMKLKVMTENTNRTMKFLMEHSKCCLKAPAQRIHQPSKFLYQSTLQSTARRTAAKAASAAFAVPVKASPQC